MTRQEIYKTLKGTYPNATNIFPNQFGEWDVEIEFETEVLVISFKAEGDKLRCVGEMTVEQ